MISLLYPENYRKSGNVICQSAVESLELDYIAMLILPYNTDFALKVLTELITDETVIKWRQDIEKVEVFQREDKGIDVKIVFNGDFGME